MASSAKTSQETRGRAAWPTSVRTLEQTAVGQHQRERILAAAIELIAKRGYSDTSADRICKKAGVSFPTFRKHFRDKEECFLAAFDETIDAGARLAAEAEETAAEDWAARIVAGTDAILAGVAERPAQARLCLVEAFSAGTVGIERYEATVRRLIPWLRDGREGMEDSSKLPELLEETILGGVAWAIHRKVAVGEAAQASELRAGLLGTLLTPYLGGDRARTIVEQETTGSQASSRED